METRLMTSVGLEYNKGRYESKMELVGKRVGIVDTGTHYSWFGNFGSASYIIVQQYKYLPETGEYSLVGPTYKLFRLGPNNRRSRSKKAGL